MDDNVLFIIIALNDFSVYQLEKVIPKSSLLFVVIVKYMVIVTFYLTILNFFSSNCKSILTFL